MSFLFRVPWAPMFVSLSFESKCRNSTWTMGVSLFWGPKQSINILCVGFGSDLGIGGGEKHR